MSKKSIVIHIVGAAIILLGLVESINYNRKVLSRANNIEPMDLVSWGIGIMISLAIALLLVAGYHPHGAVGLGNRNLLFLKPIPGHDALGPQLESIQQL